MSIFKDIIAADVHSVFLNVEEFSDMHNINGVDMPVQEDSNDQHMDGAYTNQKLIYVAALDYGPMPKQGSMLVYDGKRYKVSDAIEEDGIYSITLEAMRA